MAIAYSGGTLQNVLFSQSAGTKQELINEVETVLLAAGWTTISGHNTTALLMQSAKTAQNLQMRLWVKDNGGNCITLSISTVDGTVVGSNSTTAGGQLLPAVSKSWRLIAGPFQAFIFNNVVASPVAARDFVAFGVPWLPSNLSTVMTSAIWLQASGAGDTDTGGTQRTLRDWLVNTTSNNTSTYLGFQQTITNNVLNQTNNSGNCAGVLAVGMFGGWGVGGPNAYSFYNGDVFAVDPWIFWGAASINNASQCMGMLWDAFVVTDSIAGNSTGSFVDSGVTHSAFALTNNDGGAAQLTPRGCVCLVTS